MAFTLTLPNSYWSTEALIFYSTIGALVLGTAILSSFIMGIFGGNKFVVKGKTVLITGASEGMGKGVAVELAKKGANVIIVARRVDKLEVAVEDLKSAAISPTQRFHFISQDVGELGAATKILTQTMAFNNGAPPDIVWCVAGMSIPHLFLDLDIPTMRQQMDVNYWSCADMAHAILGIWLSPEHSSTPGSNDRHLIFTSSVLAFYSLVGYSSYSPAKAAIRTLSDTLYQEVLLYPNPPKIHTIFPATIVSPAHEYEQRVKPEITKKLEETDSVQAPEETARASIKGLENGEYLITCNFMGLLMRSCAWGGSERSWHIRDWLLECTVSSLWGIIAWVINRDVRKWGIEKERSLQSAGYKEV